MADSATIQSWINNTSGEIEQLKERIQKMEAYVSLIQEAKSIEDSFGKKSENFIEERKAAATRMEAFAGQMKLAKKFSRETSNAVKNPAITSKMDNLCALATKLGKGAVLAEDHLATLKAKLARLEENLMQLKADLAAQIQKEEAEAAAAAARASKTGGKQ